MENYAKVILYTYSKMEEMDADLKEHIRFKAFTSYDYRRSTEAIAEYIAEQVISRRTLCELKGKIQKALSSLSSEEQLLLELRYFGGLEKVVHTVRGCLRRSDEPTVREKKVCERLSLKRIWSERSYFRKQKALLEKIEKKLQSVGLSETLFWEKYGELDLFKAACRVLERGRETATICRELAFVRKLKEACKKESR